MRAESVSTPFPLPIQAKDEYIHLKAEDEYTHLKAEDEYVHLKVKDEYVHLKAKDEYAHLKADTATSAKAGGSTGSASIYEKLISACSGALVTSLVVTPLDVVKIRMQAQEKVPPLSTSRLVPSGNSSYVFCTRFFDHVEPCSCRTLYIFDRPPTSSAAASMRTFAINGTFDGMLKISKYEGVTGLWRGLSPTLVMAIPATIAYYLGYESIKERLQQSPQFRALGGMRSDFIAPLIAGSAARIMAVSLISPLELMKTKMQHYDGSHGLSLIMQELRRSMNQKGLKVLYRGLVPTLWRDVPFSAVYWTSYERFRSLFAGCLPAPRTHFDHFSHSFAAGATAGMIAAALTTPFDVAKTRQQVMDITSDANRKSIARHLLDIWRAWRD